MEGWCTGYSLLCNPTRLSAPRSVSAALQLASPGEKHTHIHLCANTCHHTSVHTHAHTLTLSRWLTGSPDTSLWEWTMVWPVEEVSLSSWRWVWGVPQPTGCSVFSFSKRYTTCSKSEEPSRGSIPSVAFPIVRNPLRRHTRKHVTHIHISLEVKTCSEEVKVKIFY